MSTASQSLRGHFQKQNTAQGYEVTSGIDTYFRIWLWMWSCKYQNINYDVWTALAALGFPYGTAGTRIIIPLMRRPKTVFISAHSLNLSCLAYIARLNLFTEFSILLDDWEITKSGVARPKFLISVLSARDNYEKLMTCRYFTLFFFMFTLKVQVLKIKTFTNTALKTATSKFLSKCVWKVRKVKRQRTPQPLQRSLAAVTVARPPT